MRYRASLRCDDAARVGGVDSGRSRRWVSRPATTETLGFGLGRLRTRASHGQMLGKVRQREQGSRSTQKWTLDLIRRIARGEAGNEALSRMKLVMQVSLQSTYIFEMSMVRGLCEIHIAMESEDLVGITSTASSYVSHAPGDGHGGRETLLPAFRAHS